MYKIGIKLWSTNFQYASEIVRLRRDARLQYVELFSVPGSFQDTIRYWSDLKVEYIIHAPHSAVGLNLADKNKFQSNNVLAREAFDFADSLQAAVVIFHPGINGSIDETIRQIQLLRDNRICIENKPFLGIQNELCVGYGPDDITHVVQQTGAAFCLDLGHAICAANSMKKAPLPFMHEFLKLRPALFHLTDGDFSGEHDRHDHFGSGDFPIMDLLDLIPDGSRVTNEAKHDSPNDLHDFEKDVEYLKTLRPERFGVHYGKQ